MHEEKLFSANAAFHRAPCAAARSYWSIYCRYRDFSFDCIKWRTHLLFRYLIVIMGGAVDAPYHYRLAVMSPLAHLTTRCARYGHFQRVRSIYFPRLWCAQQRREFMEWLIMARSFFIQPPTLRHRFTLPTLRRHAQRCRRAPRGQAAERGAIRYFHS